MTRYPLVLRCNKIWPQSSYEITWYSVSGLRNSIFKIYLPSTCRLDNWDEYRL